MEIGLHGVMENVHRWVGGGGEGWQVQKTRTCANTNPAVVEGTAREKILTVIARVDSW